MRIAIASGALLLFLWIGGCSENDPALGGPPVGPFPCQVEPADLLPNDLSRGYECLGINDPAGATMTLEDWTESFAFEASPAELRLEYDPGPGVGTIACSYLVRDASCEEFETGDTIELQNIVAAPTNDPRCVTVSESPFVDVSPGSLLLTTITVVNPRSHFNAIVVQLGSNDMAISCIAR